MVCTQEEKANTATAKQTFSRNKDRVWSIALYGVETWTRENKNKERMEKIRRTDKVRDEKILERFLEKRENIGHYQKEGRS